MLSDLRARIASWLKIASRQESEREFLPAALEIIETPASPAGRALAATIMAFFLIALIWACAGSVDIIATARGKIVSTSRTKIIQPFETGVVRAIHVRDGQQVKAGDVLVEIDSTINEAERDRLQKDYIASQLDVARLQAMLRIFDNRKSEMVAPEGASAQQIQLQRDMLLNQAEEIRAKLGGIDRQIAQNEGNLAAVKATINKITRSVPMLKERARVRNYLAKKGYGSKIESLATQQELMEYEQELEVQKGRLEEAGQSVASLKEQRRQVESEYKRNIINDLSQAEQKTASLHEQVLQATQKYKLQTLSAPVPGTVQQLAVHTEGGVVTPAQMLMAIAPEDSRLEIEAMISNRDIGFVRGGQKAEIKVDAFNFTKYGLVHGVVESVSQDAIAQAKTPGAAGGRQAGAEDESSEPEGQQLVYAARVTMDRTKMQIDDRLVTLSPGMAVTVEIKTGTRQVIEYILSPILRYRHEALRER